MLGCCTLPHASPTRPCASVAARRRAFSTLGTLSHDIFRDVIQGSIRGKVIQDWQLTGPASDRNRSRDQIEGSSSSRSHSSADGSPDECQGERGRSCVRLATRAGRVGLAWKPTTIRHRLGHLRMICMDPGPSFSELTQHHDSGKNVTFLLLCAVDLVSAVSS